MSESRPNRILNASTSLPNHHTLQPAHQQVRPALTQAYQQLLAPLNNPVAVPPRPMVVQYAVPHYPPGHQVLPQTCPQYPSQIQTPTRAVQPPSLAQTQNNTASNLTMDRLSQSLVAALTPSLVDYEKSVDAKIKEVEGSIEKFAVGVKEARNETDSRLSQLTDVMHKSLHIQQAHIKATNKRIEKIEALIMASFDRNDGMSLASCLENIQYTVGELSERIKDPGARDFFILSPTQTTDTAETRVLPRSPESIEERTATLVQHVYEDKATFCDILEPPPERAPGSVGPIYKDAASDAMNLEPGFSAMASLIQPEYKNVGNGRRTPSLPPQSGQILNSILELSSSSESDYPRSSTPSSHEELSKVTTSIESRNDTEILVDVEEVNSSPRLESQQVQFECDDSMVIDVELTVKSKGLDKMVTNNESHDDAKMDDERKSDFLAEVTIEHQPNFTSRSLTSDDESVTAPRRTIYSSSRESSLFTPSPEQRTLPSPATTPSAPSSPKLSPPANSTIATTPNLQFTGTPVWTVLSRNPSSSPEFETALPEPDYAKSTLIPVPTPSTPESVSLFNVNATPYSNNESEIVVSHIVTAQCSDSPEIPRVSSPVAPALEHVERPQAQTSLDDIPLFFSSKSQSPPPLPVDDASFESSGPFLESPPSSPKPNDLSAFKSPSIRPPMPVIVQPTSPTKAPATIIDAPFNKLRGNGGHNSRSVVSTPQKTQMIKRPIVVRTPRLHVSPPKKSVPKPRLSSPIYVPSRSLSPLSVISSTSEPELELDSVLDSAKVIRKKQRKKNSSQIEPRMSTSTSASVRRIDLSQKILAKKGVSTALTRVKKRKAPTAEQMEPPLKRARQKAVAAEAAREVRVKRERLSAGLPSVSVGGNFNARGKGKAKERGDDKGYRVPSINKIKASPTKEEKKLRPRALPPGVKWPQKNTSGNTKLDQQFIECDKCYMWYHYGCIGILDSNDAIAKREEMFICPPCTGGGANPMLPSDSIVCGRPDCEREGKKDDEYFMTGILGRYTKVLSGIGRTYMWLVKWDGYSIRECTWEEEDGMSDPQSFIQDFYRKATREGKDPDEDRFSTILLREAISGGWTDPNA